MKTSWRTTQLWLLPIAIIGFLPECPAYSRPTANIDQPIHDTELEDKSSVFSLHSRITDLSARDLLELTRIIPNHKDNVVSRTSPRIEDVDWIPVRENVAGKKGTVTILWLVDPSEKVEFRACRVDGDRDLCEIVTQVARKYQFKPTVGSRKYRLITTKYIFPAR